MISLRALPVIAAALALAALGLSACGNPVIDQRIDALPPEVAGVPPSEWHRPNQPCLLCHGPYGGAKPEMSIAGTVNAIPISGKEKAVGVEDVIVTITDSFGEVKTKKTNCIGNFYITADEWQPGFPLAAKIEYPTPGGANDQVTPAYMSTRIGRDGSCAGCHAGERGEGSPGIIFAIEADKSPFPPPGDDCKGVP